jgi:hypothetical protein
MYDHHDNAGVPPITEPLVQILAKPAAEPTKEKPTELPPVKAFEVRISELTG